MRVRVIAAYALALAALVMAAPAWAQDDDPMFKVTGEVRARWEYLENLADAQDHDSANPGADDAFDIWPYRVRLGVTGDFGNNLKALVEVQNFGAFGNESPTKTAFFAPFPHSQTLDIGGQDTTLYQGYFEIGMIGGSDWTLRVGRQEHTIGNELFFGDGDFYNGVSFDGVRAMWDRENWGLNLFYYRANETNEGCTGFCVSDVTDIYGGHVNFDIGMGEIEPYIIFVHDGDTTGGGSVYNLGARWTRGIEETEAVFDWNVEAALQDGDLKPTGSREAYVAEGWFGFNFGNDRRHRVHVGAYMASGDDNLADDDAEDFVPLFQDSWAHNRLGDTETGDAIQAVFVDGITDINVGYRFRGERNSFRASVHDLTTTEESTLVSDDIGLELDAAWDHMYNQYFALTAGLGYIDFGDAFGTDTDAGMRVYAQGRLRF